MQSHCPSDNYICAGRHLQFYLEINEQSKSSGAQTFIVPYTDIRSLIGESQDQFGQAWQASLKSASDVYSRRLRLVWGTIFEDIFTLSGVKEQKCRGLPHDEAIQIYVSTMPESRLKDLFTNMKRLHSSASMNAEALRKLVKKFDKGAVARGDTMLTPTLVPELFSAPFMAYPTLEAHIETLRDSLVVNDNEEEIFEEEEEDAERGPL